MQVGGLDRYRIGIMVRRLQDGDGARADHPRPAVTKADESGILVDANADQVGMRLDGSDQALQPSALAEMLVDDRVVPQPQSA